MSNGIVQLRRLIENEGSKATQNSDEEYIESLQEDGKEGEISLGPKNIAGGLSGKAVDRTINKKGFKKGVNTKSNEISYSSSEDVIDYDNGYSKLEKDLIRKGILQEIQNEFELKEYSSLIKITGTSKFFDWNSILDLFSDKEIFSTISNQLAGNQQKSSHQKKNEQRNMTLALKVIKIFSLGTITIHTHIGKSGVVGSINPENLCMTQDQLRTSYIMPGDVEATIVGLIPRRNLGTIDVPGLAGTINMTDIWRGLVGDVDIAIDPIAIYTEVNT
jgi:hypothetical protein